MPVYEYKCSQCDHEVELLQKHNEPAPKCAKCLPTGEVMEKMISVGSFSLKGDGWAKDNYGLKAGE